MKATLQFVVVAIFLASVSSAQENQSQQSSRPAESKLNQQAVVRWIKGNAIPVKTVEAGNGFADLQPLKKIFADVRFVGLGEQTHGTREFFQFKHRMLEFLVKEMGFRVFTIEAGYSASQKINDYVLGKSNDGAEALTSQGYWLWNTEEVRAMIDWMREYNKSVPVEKRVKFVGFDIQYHPPGQGRLTEYVNRAAPKQAGNYAELLKADLGQLFEDLVKADKQKQAAATLENLRRMANDLYVFLDLNGVSLEAKSNADEYHEMREFARNIAQNIDSYYTNGQAAVGTLRDSFMADNFRRIVSREPAGTKFVVWAHNGHLATTDLDGRFPSIGYHLRRMYGKDYYALGFSFNSGSFQARLASPNTIHRTVTGLTPLTAFTVGNAPQASVDWYLAQANQKLFVIDLRSSRKNADVKAWLDTPNPMRLIGSFYAPHREESRFLPTIVGAQFDGLFFVDTTTRARPNKSVKNVAQR